MKLTRRDFLQSATKTAAAVALVKAHPSLGELPQSATREPLRELPYSAVKLSGGPFAAQYDALHAHYLSLSNDRLLKVYRQRAGMPAPGQDMGGWYDLDGFVPGHSLGQYISGLARFGASTDDAACREKVQSLVGGFGETLGPHNESILRPKTNLWTCYILDKHFVGLIDAATLAGDSSATELLHRVLAGAEPLLPAEGRDRIGKKNPPYDETYIMPENLFLAAELTGNPRFHDLALRYLLNKEFFDPLAKGDDPFPGQHAYSHAMALSSAGKAYLALGDAKYRDAMRQAFTLLTTEQQFASGGWGPNETFITPHRGELYASLNSTVDHFETPCGSYAATKLARYLLRTGTPSSTEHADNLERVLFNAILAARSPDSNGDYFYYSTYSAAANKVFYPSKWPCCSGTLAQTVADYPLNIAFTAADGLYLVLYTPSMLHFTHARTRISIEQKTAFPAEDHVSLQLSMEHPSLFTLYLRMPGWLASAATISVNGKAMKGQRGTFAAVRRTWRDGDRIELTLPQDFHTEAIDEQHPETVALTRGPVQYVAIEGSSEPTNGRRLLPASLKAAGVQTYVERYAGVETIFTPLHSITNETYTSYFSKA